MAIGLGGPCTIYHVAEAAGVSIKTVSRVLNREPNVRPETRDRVLSAATTLRYVPNVSARSLAGSRAYLLALLIDNPSAGYVADLQLGATARCREEGYHLIVEPYSTGAPEALGDLSALLAAVKLDGLILSPPVCDDPGVLDVLDAFGAAYVRIAPGTDFERSDRIGIDDDAAARDMTQALLDLGHRRIAFVTGPKDHVAADRRLLGFLGALRARGVAAHPAWIQEGDFGFLSGRAAAQRLLSQRERPSAVFAANDDMALGVMSFALEYGLRVPGELSVCGFDDTPAAGVVWPRLSTVRQPVADMARAAADLLIGRARRRAGDPPVQRRLNYALVMRDSLAAPAV